MTLKVAVTRCRHQQQSPEACSEISLGQLELESARRHLQAPAIDL